MAGQTIRLLGVNHTSAEYACVDGFGYDDGHFDAADAAADRLLGRRRRPDPAERGLLAGDQRTAEQQSRAPTET